MTPWDPFDVPYDIHTNRELEFMLRRGKPLAHFCDAYPPDPDEDMVPRAAFAPYVQSGEFDAREFVTLLKVPLERAAHVLGTIHVLYARASESWRIDAYINMQMEGEITGWSERLERLQGTLLGYTDAENDAHIDHALRSPNVNNFPWLGKLARLRAP